MEAAQVVLIAVVTVLTVLLSVIGVQLFFILREVRHSLQKINCLLDEAGGIIRSVAQPAAAIGGGLAQISAVLKVIGRFLGGRKDV
jgi:hypothetical protein